MVSLKENQVQLNDGRIVTISTGKVRHFDAAVKAMGDDKPERFARYLVPYICKVDGKVLTTEEYCDLFLEESMPIQKKILELNGFNHNNKEGAQFNEVNLPNGKTVFVARAKMAELDKAQDMAGKDTHKTIRYLMPLLVVVDNKHLIMEDFEAMPLDCYMPIQLKLQELNPFL